MRCILAEDNRNVLIANDKSKMVVNCKKMWALARLPKSCDLTLHKSMASESQIAEPTFCVGLCPCWLGDA
jgi:hypothetical protein